MNDWDRDNLQFILNTTDESFEDWLDQADNDDVEYALSLIRTAKAELLTQEYELLDEVNDMSDANLLIDRIRNVRKD
jgi:adenine C2-methylase RlmN of 23S rRNA A2503 and tRNA A37